MTHPYAADLVEAFQTMAKVDFTKITGLVFLGEIRLNLINEGFTVKEAEKIAVAMAHTELQPGALTDEQVSELALAVARTLSNIGHALREVGFYDPVAGVIEMASKMTIKLS